MKSKTAAKIGKTCKWKGKNASKKRANIKFKSLYYMKNLTFLFDNKFWIKNAIKV